MSYKIKDLLKALVDNKGSDLHIHAVLHRAFGLRAD